MIHKTRLTLLSLGCVTASASASYDPHFWGGLGIGLASNTQHMRQYDTTSFPGLFNDGIPTPPYHRKASLNNLSGAGFFQLGWGMNLNKFHLGAFFDLPGGSLKDSFSLVSAPEIPADAMVRVKSKFFGYGGGIRLGYRMDKFLLFTSLGAISRRFKVTWDQRVDNPGAPDLENTIISDKKAFTALVPGVGLEYWVTPCMALGMVANVQFYPSKTFESEGTDRDSGLGSSLKLRPRGVSGLLSASYKFNL